MTDDLITLAFSDQLWWGKSRRKENKKLAAMSLIPFYENDEWKPFLIIGVDEKNKKEVVQLFQLEEKLRRTEYKQISAEFRRWRRWIESTRILEE